MNSQKKQKYYFGFLGPTRINPRSYVSPNSQCRIKGYVVLYENLFKKLFDLIFFIILKTFFMFVFGNLNYLEICVTRAVKLTLKIKQRIFYFSFFYIFFIFSKGKKEI